MGALVTRSPGVGLCPSTTGRHDRPTTNQQATPTTDPTATRNPLILFRNQSLLSILHSLDRLWSPSQTHPPESLMPAVPPSSSSLARFNYCSLLGDTAMMVKRLLPEMKHDSTVSSGNEESI
eukprot:scaffold18243_cov26-Attheya_sp.AAC.1